MTTDKCFSSIRNVPKSSAIAYSFCKTYISRPTSTSTVVKTTTQTYTTTPKPRHVVTQTVSATQTSTVRGCTNEEHPSSIRDLLISDPFVPGHGNASSKHRHTTRNSNQHGKQYGDTRPEHSHTNNLGHHSRNDIFRLCHDYSHIRFTHERLVSRARSRS